MGDAILYKNPASLSQIPDFIWGMRDDKIVLCFLNLLSTACLSYDYT